MPSRSAIMPIGRSAGFPSTYATRPVGQPRYLFASELPSRSKPGRFLPDVRRADRSPAPGGLSADAVVLRKIIDNRCCIIRRYRGTEDADHLVHLGLPTLAIEKWRVGAQIVEAVAGAAVPFDCWLPGRLREGHRLLLRARARSDHQHEDKQDEWGFHRTPIKRR